MIPKIIHWAYGLSPDAPPINETYLAWRHEREALYPGYSFRYYDRSNVFDLAPPMPQRLRIIYFRKETGAHRADVLRLWLAASVGGLWFDSDMKPKANVEPLLRGVTALLAGMKPTRTNIVMQRLETAFMATAPNHLFYAYLLDILPQWYYVHEGQSLAVCTGPQFVQYHLDKWKPGPPLSKVAIAPPNAFCPFLWNEKDKSELEYPGNFEKHYWSGSWKP